MIRTFHASPPTLGLELEWQLVDRSTLDLREQNMTLLEELSGDPRIKPELHACALETITAPAESTAALCGDLRELVGRLIDVASRFGMTLVGSGTHAFCDRLIRVTPLPRYAAVERDQGYFARARAAYSLQAHVGMPSGEVALRVLRDLRGLLPVFLGLSASSPFFHGCETAFSSYRARLLAAARSYGMPPHFEDWEAFVRFLDTAEGAKMFSSFRDMHWDARLRPDFGTIEVRIMDAQPTLARSLALAALVHSLAVHLASAKPSEPPLVEPLPWWLEKENAFRASHDGMDASLICDPRGTVRPLRGIAEDLFVLVAPTARALGEEEDLARARAILTGENCAGEQREVFRRTGSTPAVVLALANELLGELGREPLEDRFTITAG